MKSSGKMNALVEVVRELAPRRKVVVWCQFRAEIDWASEVLASELGPDAVVFIDGRVSDEDREARVERLRVDPACRVMVAQVASMGFGVNLQAASAAVYVTNPWSYEKRTQSEARIHRLGQTENCLYVDLICPGTVDESVLEALRRKASLGKQVTAKQWERFLHGRDQDCG